MNGNNIRYSCTRVLLLFADINIDLVSLIQLKYAIVSTVYYGYG